jgi:Tol biopolymer transport system component
MFSASWTGSVAYHSGRDIGQLVWADRNGSEVGTISTPADYQPYAARLSRDDSALLVPRKQAGLGTFDIWWMDLGRRTERALTSGRGSEITPAWIDDGSMLFAGDSPGSLPHLFRKDLATGAEQQLSPPGYQQASMDVSSNGRTVFYVERGSEGFRLFQLPLARGASPTPLPLGELSVSHMRLSPDDRAMAFIAGDSEGRMDAYVSALPVTSQLVKVADKVSSPPRWSRNGGRLYFVKDDTMMTLTVSTVPEFRVGEPQPLFKLQRKERLQDVFRDGRFLLLVPQVRADEHPITVWTAAIASTRR